jgi:hypothetical protein
VTPSLVLEHEMKPAHVTAHYTSQRAVMECGCDAKTGERRGPPTSDDYSLPRVFSEKLPAQLPPSPQRDQGRCVISRQPKHLTATLQKPASNALKQKDIRTSYHPWVHCHNNGLRPTSRRNPSLAGWRAAGCAGLLDVGADGGRCELCRAATQLTQCN